jgi:hypothetical protein
MGNDPQSRATETVAFCSLDQFTTLCRLGLGLGGPWVAPKGHPSVAQGRAQASIQESALVATKVEKWRVGDWNGLDADVARMDADQEESNRNQQSYLRSTRQEGY